LSNSCFRDLTGCFFAVPAPSHCVSSFSSELSQFTLLLIPPPDFDPYVCRFVAGSRNLTSCPQFPPSRATFLASHFLPNHFHFQKIFRSFSVLSLFFLPEFTPELMMLFSPPFCFPVFPSPPFVACICPLQSYLRDQPRPLN